VSQIEFRDDFCEGFRLSQLRWLRGSDESVELLTNVDES
jgi:hypothetical protein